MVSNTSPLRGFDLRALPIAIKISVGVLFALVIGGIVTDTIMSQVVRDTQTDQTERDLQAFSRSQALRTLDLINEETSALNRLGTSTVVQEQLLTHEVNDLTQPLSAGALLYQANSTLLIRQVIDFKDQHPEFDSVLVLDTNGHILAAYPNTVAIETVTEANWPWFLEATKEGVGATFISGPMDDGLTGTRGIHIAAPIYNLQSSSAFSVQGLSHPLIGVVYSVWNMRNAESLLVPGTDRQGIVIDSKGMVILSPFQARGEALDRSLMTQIAVNIGDGRFTYTDATGEGGLYGFTRFNELNVINTSSVRPDWVAIVRAPSTVLESNIALLSNRLRVLLLAVALVAAVVALISSRALFNPLRRLMQAATDIEGGNLERPIPQFPKDEIGRLAATLNNVVTQLFRRVRQLRSAVQISRVTVVGHTTDQMLTDVARATGQQFDYPDVRIYLIDASGQRVRLEAAFGAESERLLKMGYRIALDEETLVGRAMLLNEPLLGGGKEALRHAGLITEHSELAAPLSAGGVLLGAIHILAGRLRELDEEDIEVMTLVADQLGTAIQNARLLEQGRAQVAEIEALNRRLTRQAWEEYVGDSGALRHTLDPDEHWPATLGEVRERTEIKAESYTDVDGRSILAAPLILRGEAMGTLAISRPAGEKWSQDEVLLLESIASRMAMIAEGIRLVEESSRRAEREQRVNEISASMLQRATSVETVLRSALSELGGALGSDRISLRIGSVPVRSDRQIGAGAPADDNPSLALPSNGGEQAGPDASLDDTGSNGDGGVKNDS